MLNTSQTKAKIKLNGFFIYIYIYKKLATPTLPEFGEQCQPFSKVPLPNARENLA
jgi:hypothetical protein